MEKIDPTSLLLGALGGFVLAKVMEGSSTNPAQAAKPLYYTPTLGLGARSFSGSSPCSINGVSATEMQARIGVPGRIRVIGVARHKRLTGYDYWLVEVDGVLRLFDNAGGWVRSVSPETIRTAFDIQQCDAFGLRLPSEFLEPPAVPADTSVKAPVWNLPRKR